MSFFEKLIEKIDRDPKITNKSIKHIEYDYIAVNVYAGNLLRGIKSWTYLILLESKYISTLKKSPSPRNKLLRDLRKEIRDNESKFITLIAAGSEDTSYLIGLLEPFKDLKHFPVLEASVILNTEHSFSNALISLLISFPYRNFFFNLCPYSIDHIPRGNMFYGRKSEIKKMFNSSSNIIITGARRIGKTSLIYNFKDFLGTIPISAIKLDVTEINKCAIVDVSNLADYESDIWEKIFSNFQLEKSLYLPFARRIREGQPYKNFVYSLEKLLGEHNGELVIILDEVDSWIKEDAKNDWRVLNQLRSITDRGIAKVVLVGYETLQIYMAMPRFPFIGRYELIELGPLDRKDIEALIIEPMKELKISIDPKYEQELIAEIWSISGGRPNLAQGFCLELINLLVEESSDIKIIRKNHLLAAKASSSFYKEYLKSIRYGGRPLARLICGVSAYLISKYSKDIISVKKEEIIQEMETSFNYSYDSENFRLQLAHLKLRHILIESNSEKGIYKFTNKNIYKEFNTMINNDGYKRWGTDLLNKHKKIKENLL